MGSRLVDRSWGGPTPAEYIWGAQEGVPFGASRGNASWLCLAHRVVIRLTFVPKLLTKANPEAAVGAVQPGDVGQMS